MISSKRARRVAVYPGSFDPVTLGHLDVIERAANLFDDVIVAPAVNAQKSHTFPIEVRIDFLKECTARFENVEVAPIRGLLVDFARDCGAQVIIRGLRAVSDFEFEFQMALMNRKLSPRLETIFFTPKEDYTYLSSRIVKEIARLGGDVSKFVPGTVNNALREVLASRSEFVDEKEPLRLRSGEWKV